MKQPLISIVIPAYNYGRYLGSCIDSILEQTYTNWELIVIDNGSSDHTPEVLAKYSDPRIRKHKIEVNEGPVKAWAFGFEEARGEYFALLPADDMFTPTKLERQVQFLSSHPEIDCVGTYINVINDDGSVWNKKHWMLDAVNISIDFSDMKHWYWKHHFCIPTAIYPRDMCILAGGIPLDGLTNICDWDFHIRLLGVGAKFAVIPEKLTQYRWHDSNTSRQKANTHNQWIYSHTRSFLPAAKAISPDFPNEIVDSLKALYLDPKLSYFLEEAPPNWRCAHLEALLHPAAGLEHFAHYKDFLRHTETWTADTLDRTAIVGLDAILMELRGKLIKKYPNTERNRNTTNDFPAEKQFREVARTLGWPIMTAVYLFINAKKELRRKIAKWFPKT